MDLTLNDVMTKVCDPASRAEVIQQLQANVTCLEDEDGNKYDVIRLADYNISKQMADNIFKERADRCLPSGGEASGGMPQLPPGEMPPSAGGTPPSSGGPPGGMPPGVRPRLVLHDVRGFPLRDDDVLVCSYAKTGSHWFGNLIRFLRMDGPLENEISYQPPLLDLFPAQMIEALPSPRTLITHRRLPHLPKDIAAGRRKVILIYRNPKDTAVSLFYHLKSLPFTEKVTINWKCYIKAFTDGLMPFDDYFAFYNAWQEHIAQNKDLDILVASFEEMKTNGINELRRIKDHLGLTHSDARLQEVIDKCSINKLRNDVNDGKVTTLLKDKEGKSLLYRKGVIGDWKTHFTVAQSEAMDAVIQEKVPADTIFKYSC